MKPFGRLTAIAAPIDQRNVDTDAIIPARFLRQARADFCAAMFHDLRHDAAGVATDFVLNRPIYRDAQILVADENFGCGSSREAAVWALAEHDGRVLAVGIRCVIAPSLGDIFYNNCTKNGVLPVRLPTDACSDLRRLLHERPGARLTVDLPAQRVEGPDGRSWSFEIDPRAKRCLIEGLDDVGLTEKHAGEIAAFEARLAHERPWQ